MIGQSPLPPLGDKGVRSTVKITETQFVELLKRHASRNAKGLSSLAGLRRGIGDDCAVISHTRQKDLLVTTDLFLEGVHFRRAWQEPRSIGHKTLARGLSDIAAMGGTPLYAFLSLGLPRETTTDWLNDFLKGFFKLARTSNVVLAGGDTGTSRSGFIADVIVAGEAPRGKSILRSGARPGDEVWVTGHLGLAAAGLRAIETATVRQRPRLTGSKLLRSFFYPQPRLRIGSFLRERRLASAMIDLSDGLSLDLSRLCKESEVGARIFEASIPRTSRTPIRDALHGGEDMELLFTIPTRKSGALPRSIGGVKLTRIGEIIPPRRAGQNLLIVRDGKERPLPVLGFQHF